GDLLDLLDLAANADFPGNARIGIVVTGLAVAENDEVVRRHRINRMRGKDILNLLLKRIALRPARRRLLFIQNSRYALRRVVPGVPSARRFRYLAKKLILLSCSELAVEVYIVQNHLRTGRSTLHVRVFVTINLEVKRHRKKKFLIHETPLSWVAPRRAAA